MLRKIVRIDEEKCDGCGQCVPACAEGALQIIDGKARIVKEMYCDGLGACLGDCPQGAISIEEREADPFDETAVEEHLSRIRSIEKTTEPLACGCPGSAMRTIERTDDDANCYDSESTPSALTTWPVQLMLVPPGAHFLKGADILISADCVPFAYPDFHRDFINGRVVLVGCPKLDDISHYREKLEAIFREARPSSVTVVRMEVPCCMGIALNVQDALEASVPGTPFDVKVIGVKGEVRNETFPGVKVTA